MSEAKNDESDLSALLCAIDELDERIRVKSVELLLMRNEFLKKSGWEITREKIGPTHSYFYQKFGDLLICEHDAIDREINGT